MPPRPLDLLDLPILYRYRAEAISLDTTRLLTRGNPLSAVGLMAYLNPARHLYSAINPLNGTSLLGGVTHLSGDPFARLLYLAPLSALTHPDLPSLIENLAAEAGNWGAFHILAEADEDSDAFPALRAAGFSVYAWQRIWDLSEIPLDGGSRLWQKASATSLPAIQSLFHQIVPPLLHPIEPMPKRALGLVCNDGIKGYVQISYGLAGILFSPLIHPEATGVTEKLVSLLNHLPDRRSRPVYLCMRSYQAWLEPALQDLGARPGPRQAVMVKHLTRLVKDEQAVLATQPARVVPASRAEIKREK
jgi:hypothetical protein